MPKYANIDLTKDDANGICNCCEVEGVCTCCGGGYAALCEECCLVFFICIWCKRLEKDKRCREFVTTEKGDLIAEENYIVCNQCASSLIERLYRCANCSDYNIVYKKSWSPPFERSCGCSDRRSE